MNKKLNVLVEQFKLMAAGIKNHPENLEAIGINEETSALFESIKEKLERLNAEQEELKTKAKQKTKELQDEIEKASKLYSDTKKMVKVKTKQIIWKSFGIDDKR